MITISYIPVHLKWDLGDKRFSGRKSFKHHSPSSPVPCYCSLLSATLGGVEQCWRCFPKEIDKKNILHLDHGIDMDYINWKFFHYDKTIKHGFLLSPKTVKNVNKMLMLMLTCCLDKFLTKSSPDQNNAHKPCLKSLWGGFWGGGW